MRTDLKTCLTAALALATTALVPPVFAQSTGAPSTSPAPTAPGSGALGSGPGYHDPRSPFKPLQEKDGVVSWQVLSSVTTRPEKNRLVPVFPSNVQSLNNQTVRVQGFMLPLEAGEKQRHFLLSSVPTTCSFCVPAGPEGLVEVRSNAPVKYTLEPVLVEGKLAVLPNDPYGLYYRVVNAAPVN